MHSDDAMELRVTWEEAQELLRPAPNAEATVVIVEDFEFEEFDVSFVNLSSLCEDVFLVFLIFLVFVL